MFNYLKGMVLVGLLSVAILGCAKENRPPEYDRYLSLSKAVVQQATVRVAESHPKTVPVIKEIVESLRTFALGFEGDSVRGQLVPIVVVHIERLEDLKAEEKLLLVNLSELAENEVAMLLDRLSPADRVSEVIREHVVLASDWILMALIFVE